MDWAEAQDGRHEFDGLQPVAMTGGSLDHNQIMHNAYAAFDTRLRAGCRPLGPDVAVPTIGAAIRFPDLLVTCSPASGTSRTVTEPVLVLEVISPSSGRMDRIVKAREYAGVASVRHYLMLEATGVGATLLSRTDAEARWSATVLAEGDVLAIPALDIEIPLAEFYRRVEFGPDPAL